MTEQQPPWIDAAPPEGSWRALFKWGAPGEFKHPNPRLFRLMKRTFRMEGRDFLAPVLTAVNPWPAIGR